MNEGIEECDSHKKMGEKRLVDSINARRVVIVRCPKWIRVTRDNKYLCQHKQNHGSDL